MKGYNSSKRRWFYGFKVHMVVTTEDLNTIQRSNMGEDQDYFIKRKLRKKVETVFSIITGRFGNVIKATSIDGFLTKLKLFITAYSIDCFFKLSDDKQKQLVI